MKNFIAYQSIIIALIFLPLLSVAQDAPKDSVVRIKLTDLPPLTALIDSAIKHNAAVQFRNEDIKAKEARLKSEKLYWTRNMGLQLDSRYGTFDNFSTNSNGLSTSIFNTTAKQLNYGLGLYVKFPLVDLVDRKNQIKRANAELEQSKYQALNQEEELTQVVIKLYNDLLLKEKLLKLNSTALGNARANSEMIEKEFRNGKIPVSEYVRISDIATRVESDYEKAKTDYTTAKMTLEIVVGFKLNTIY